MEKKKKNNKERKTNAYLIEQKATAELHSNVN